MISRTDELRRPARLLKDGELLVSSPFSLFRQRFELWLQESVLVGKVRDENLRVVRDQLAVPVAILACLHRAALPSQHAR